MKQSSVLQTLVFVTLVAAFASCQSKLSTKREHHSFNRTWTFTLDDDEAFKLADFDDQQWRTLDLPHDWSIEANFDEKAPAGIGGAALPGGVGWYRKSFTIPTADSSKRIYITFDGIYQNSEVYINGHFLGKRPFGYISFQYDLTPYLNYGAENNVIAVRCDNGDQPNSRWYSGSGIYRNVWLTKTHPVHIDLWGVYLNTPKVSKTEALVDVEVTIDHTHSNKQNIKLITKIFDAENKLVAKIDSDLELLNDNKTKALQTIKIDNPTLWDVENPYLYTVENTLKIGNQEIDSYKSTLGLRSFKFDKDKGFILNGKQVKIKGVCNHHDLGALGAALNTRAKERQLEILKAMGCNGIRTSHNPPSPELLDLCDRMGFIVQNETFDVWAKKKVENDYAKYWDEWHKQDLTDHLLRDRNHPSVFSWSIGNEILEQWDSTGTDITLELTKIVKQYMPNIPVTSGLNSPYPNNYIIKSGALDLIGFNYKHEAFESFQETFPGETFIATETTSSLNSRGEYKMPSDSIDRWPIQWDIPFYDGMPGNKCSSYDNCSAPWGSTHAESWKLIKKHDYLSGMYIWTGFDYLGEPTPYQWPSRSSYFGIIDLAGFPKDAYYMYQSEWTNEPVLHVFPHWNWEKGQNVDVWAYTNFDEVELFLNGKSLGKQTKDGNKLRLQWNVKYEPGTLKAIGKNQKGETKEVLINTAGKPAKIMLKADRPVINANGSDLSFVTVTITDDKGNMVPYADNLVHFESDDLLSIAGVDNGLQTSMEPFKANKRKTYNGKCLVILKAKDKIGISQLKAKSKNLKEASLTIELN